MRFIALAFSLFAMNANAALSVMAGFPYNPGPNGDSINPLHVNSAGQITTTLSTGENTAMSALNVLENASYKQVTATGVIKASAGVLTGIFVAASTSCTIQLHDDPDSATAPIVIDTTAAITAPAFYPVKAAFSTGLYFTEGGTCNVTFFYY